MINTARRNPLEPPRPKGRCNVQDILQDREHKKSLIDAQSGGWDVEMASQRVLSHAARTLQNATKQY